LDLKTAQAREIEADIARLDTGIRQLKIQYDMFFAGSLKLPPREAHASLAKLVNKHMNTSMTQYAQRFHFNALVSRYNSLSELWGKTVRSLEEGHRPAPVNLRKSDREQLVAQCRVRDPRRDDEAMRELYKCFVDARRKIGTTQKSPTTTNLFEAWPATPTGCEKTPVAVKLSCAWSFVKTRCS
jgi:hypothetical protein